MSWKLVWSDEFDYEGQPNPEKWSYQVGASGWGNNELQYYTSERASNANVKDGKLIITAINEPYEGAKYTSARITTRGKGDFLYGKIEVSAKLPSGLGTWPAIWMMPTDDSEGWPNCGEIDIMEHVGHTQDQIHGSVHTEAYNHMINTQKTGTKIVEKVSDQFHKYSIEWDEQHISFYIDDEEYLNYSPKSYVEDVTKKEWPFSKEFYIILNIAYGGGWGGAKGIDPSVLPQAMLVDYVRVYKKV